MVASDIDNGSSDNCGSSITFSASQTSFTCADVGANPVTLTVTDGSGNTSTCTSTVTVSDTTSPTASCQNITVFLDGSGTASIVASDIDNGSTDNCTTVTLAASTTSFTCADIGANPVTLTVTDGSGNTSTCTSTVTVSDSTSPTADAATLADVTDECSVTVLTDPTATDNCGGVTVSNDATLPISTQGTTVVTWTYDDGNGNTSTQTQDVVIIDVVGPVADTSLSDLTAICSQGILTAPTATDNCAGSITGTTTTIFPITTIGATIVTWEYADGNGNITTQTQDVVISGVDVSNDLSSDGATITALNVLGTYQWIDCSDNSLVVGETSSSFTPAANGGYAVIVTEGSCADTSACVTVSTVGIGTISIVKMTVYPNPSLDGYFTISYDGAIEAIEVLDMLGRSIILPVDLNSGVVNASELADGRYIIRVKTNNGYAMSEIVIAN
jgi:hypothetical protein